MSQHLDKLKFQIQECDREIKQLELELLDVLTNVATPDNSDVEGEEVPEPYLQGVKQTLLNVEAIPVRETAYSELYLCPGYCFKVSILSTIYAQILSS